MCDNAVSLQAAVAELTGMGVQNVLLVLESDVGAGESRRADVDAVVFERWAASPMQESARGDGGAGSDVLGSFSSGRMCVVYYVLLFSFVFCYFKNISQNGV